MCKGSLIQVWIELAEQQIREAELGLARYRQLVAASGGDESEAEKLHLLEAQQKQRIDRKENLLYALDHFVDYNPARAIMELPDPTAAPGDPPTKGGLRTPGGSSPNGP